MPGFFSRMAKAAGGYATDAASYAVAGHRGMAKALGTAGRTATYGGAAGAAWGAMSDDTSVVGGALMGAGLGLGGRYARAAGRGARGYLRGNGPVSWGGLGLNMRMAAQSRAGRDLKLAGSRLSSNKAVMRVRSSLSDARDAMGNAFGYMF